MAGIGRNLLLLTKSRRYNRLEVYTFSFPDTSLDDGELGPGLDLVSSTNLLSRITVLSKFRPDNSLVDHVFVGTDQCQFFTLRWDKASCKLTTKIAAMDLADRSARAVQSGERCLTDPTNEYMTVEMYEGIVTVIPIADRKKGAGKARALLQYGVMGQPVHTRIPEFFVRSSAFIHRNTIPKPRLALLWRDHDEAVHLKIRELSAISDNSVEFVDLKEARDVDLGQLEIFPSLLIPVQEHPFGLLLVGETGIAYFNDESNMIQIQSPLVSATVWVSWTRIDNERYALADDYGMLHLLCLNVKGGVIVNWKLDELGVASRASCLVYLENGVLFIGSHFNDSQVVKIDQRGLFVTDTIPNIAPILSFTVMDMGKRSTEGAGNAFSTGQARIVTGSGGWQDGSLRSVRSGVGLEELGRLDDMAHVTKVFAISIDPSLGKHDALLVSFVNESRLFMFEPDGEVHEDRSARGLDFGERTLLAVNVLEDRLLQVTTSAITLIDLDSAMKESWLPEAGLITAVAGAGQSVAVVVNGRELILFDLQPQAINMRTKRSFDHELSCLTLSDLFPNRLFAGSWSKSGITVLDLGSLKLLKEIPLGDDAMPESVVVTRLAPEKSATVVVAMSDGHVVTFDLDSQTLDAGTQMQTILGTKQPDLQVIPFEHGVSSVFVASEHPSLIYMGDGRMAFSAVNTGRVNCICRFDSIMYPNAVVVATPKNLKIAHVDSERTTQVQRLPLGETTRRIAYSPALKAFGIGAINRVVQDGAEILQSSFKLVDEVVFKLLDTYQLLQDEVVEAVIRAPIKNAAGQEFERFIVATAKLEDQDATDFRGRIIFFEVTEDRKLKMIAMNSTRGACRCLAMVDGHLAAALTKNLVVYAVSLRDNGTAALSKQATYRIATAPIGMEVSGHEIAVADIMKSVAVLEFTPARDEKSAELVEVARHFQTMWSTAVARVEKDTWLAADTEGNLVVLARNRDGVTEHDKRQLQVVSEMRLGDMVNEIQSIEVDMPPAAVVIPKAFLGTVSFWAWKARLTAAERGLAVSLRGDHGAVQEPPDERAGQPRRDRQAGGRAQVQRGARVQQPGPAAGRAEAVRRWRVPRVVPRPVRQGAACVRRGPGVGGPAGRGQGGVRRD
jgi:DNA damage-binding protein 1